MHQEHVITKIFWMWIILFLFVIYLRMFYLHMFPCGYHLFYISLNFLLNYIQEIIQFINDESNEFLLIELGHIKNTQVKKQNINHTIEFPFQSLSLLPSGLTDFENYKLVCF